MNPMFREHSQYYTSRVDMSNPYKLADFAASLTTAGGDELQQVLEVFLCSILPIPRIQWQWAFQEAEVSERLNKALVLVAKEKEKSKIQQEIQRRVEQQLSTTQVCRVSEGEFVDAFCFD